MPAKILYCLLPILLIFSAEIHGQEQVFECELKLGKKFDTYHVVDRTRPQQYLVLVAYDNVHVIVMDSAMNKIGEKTYPITLKEEKFYLTEPLSFVARDGIIHGYYANYGLTVVGYLEFNLRAKRIRRGQVPIDLSRKDEFLFHYVLDGEFHVMSSRKKSNILNFYKVLTPKNIERIQYNITQYRNLYATFKNISAPKDMDIGIVMPDEEPRLVMATKKIKAYPERDRLTITMETVLGTEFIALDLIDKDYTEKVVHYRRFNKEGMTNNSNSFLYKDLHLVARSSGEELLVYINHKDSTEALFKERFEKDMQEIPFSNVMADGKKIYTASRYYRNNPRDFMRAIDDGNVGLHIDDYDSFFVMTVGNFEEAIRPLTDPFRSRVAGRNAGASSYFQAKLSKDLEWLPGKIAEESDRKLNAFFDQNDFKARFVYAFKHEGMDYISFQNRKTKKYHLYAYREDTGPAAAMLSPKVKE
ncbi:MAG: hypothetical protein AAGA85_06115 [Bacteroidota bacterium]